jgi:hypothetical protein
LSLPAANISSSPANPATKIPLRMNIFARLANGSCKILRTPAALPILPSSFSGK